MFKGGGDLVKYINSKLQVGNESPNNLVKVYKSKEDKDNNLPFILKNVMSLDIDRRWEFGANEALIIVSNFDGYYSPDYAPWKFPDLDLPNSGFSKVLFIESIVEIYLGYGDEDLILMFTGTIDSINIRADSQQIEIKCRSMFKKLLTQVLDDGTSKTVSYPKSNEPSWVASDILSDLFQKAGLQSIVERTVLNTPEGEEPYIIPYISFDVGTMYADASLHISDNVGYRVFEERDGTIFARPKKMPTQETPEDATFDDYVNLSNLNYEINNAIIRNKIIIESSSGWRAFMDPTLLAMCKNEFRAMKMQVAWADTDQKKKIAAGNAFGEMRRKLRTITLVIRGNPRLDIEDVISVKEIVSTAWMKYKIVSIKSTYGNEGYLDFIDLEVIVPDADAIMLKDTYHQYKTRWSNYTYLISDNETIQPTIYGGGTIQKVVLNIHNKDSKNLLATITKNESGINSTYNETQYNADDFPDDIRVDDQTGEVTIIKDNLWIRNIINGILYREGDVAIIGMKYKTNYQLNDSLELSIINLPNVITGDNQQQKMIFYIDAVFE